MKHQHHRVLLRCVVVARDVQLVGQCQSRFLIVVALFLKKIINVSNIFPYYIHGVGAGLSAVPHLDPGRCGLVLKIIFETLRQLEKVASVRKLFTVYGDLVSFRRRGSDLHAVDIVLDIYGVLRRIGTESCEDILHGNITDLKSGKHRPVISPASAFVQRFCVVFGC